jgi:hypothetical protein
MRKALFIMPRPYAHGAALPLLRAGVVGVSVVALALLHLGDVSRVMGDPVGSYGLITGGSAVASVVPGSPAARAGLHPGERIDLSQNPPALRNEIVLEDLAPHGRTTAIVRVVAPQSRTVLLRAAPEPASDAPLIVVRELLGFLPMLIAIVLLFLRPGRLTWLLFLMTLDLRDVPSDVAYFRLFTSAAAQTALDAVQIVTFVAAKAAAVAFGFALAGHALRGWRLGAVFGAAMVALPASLTTTLNGWMPGIDATVLNPSLQMLEQILLFAFVLSGLVDAVFHTRESARGKMLWLAAGLLFAAVAGAIDGVLWANYGSYAAHTALRVAPLIFLLLCAYALLATRVVDIRFAISRTVVYGGVTATLIVTFALVDLVLTRGIDQARLSLPFDVAIAVVLGFSIHNIQSHLDAFVDRMLFHRRYLATDGLARAAKAVLRLGEERAVAEYVVDLPARLLDLTGAALYRRHGRGFRLERDVRWEHLPRHCDANDPLCVYMMAEFDAVHLTDVAVRSEWPKDVVLAVPFVLRRELHGFALYGAHREGPRIDATEQRALMELVRSADLSYERIAVAEMEAELVRLRAIVDARTATT